MKKTLRNLALATSLLLAGTTAWSADLVQKNAYAYDIRVNSTELYNPVVSYKLNGLASAVKINVLADGQIVHTVDGTTDQTNSVAVSVPEAAYGNITFSLDVTTKTTVTTPTLIKDKISGNGTGSGYYLFYGPYGLTVNNCTDAETFGRILVTENRNQADIYGSAAKTNRFTSTANNGRGAMIYAFDPQWQPIANEQAGGKYGFNAALSVNTTEIHGDFNRIKYSADGRLFLATADAKRNAGVFELNPDNLNEAAVPVITQTKVFGMDVWGTGNNMEIAIFSGTYGGSTFTLSTCAIETFKADGNTFKSTGTYPYIAPTLAWYGNNMSPYLCFDPDGKGFWAGQYRSNATEPHYIHTNVGGSSADVDDRTTIAYGAGMAYNKDFTLFARCEGANTIVVYKVTNVNDGKAPTLQKLGSFAFYPSGGNRYINGIAFDYANNLYACDNSSEWVASYQLPAAWVGSSVTVPAPSSQAYVIGKVEQPKLYVIGEFNGWNVENAVELDKNLQGNYVYTLTDAEKGFKLSTKGGADFEANVLSAGADFTLYGGRTRELVAGNYKLSAPAAGNWTITLNSDNELTLTGRPAELPDVIHLVGDITDNNREDAMVLRLVAADKENPVMTEKGEYEFETEIADFYGDFSLMAGEKALGAANATLALGEKMELTAGDSKFALNGATYAGVKMAMGYNMYENGASYFTMTGKLRNHYASNLRQTMDATEGFTFTFTSSGPAEKATLHFTRRPDASDLRVMAAVDDDAVDEWGNSVNSRHYEISDIVAGENSVTIPHSWFPKVQYDWSVEIAPNVEETVITDPINIGGARGAVATFTDPHYPATYGYTVIGRANNTGIDVYDATGKLVVSRAFADNAEMGGQNPGTTAATGTPVDAVTRGNMVYFSNMSEAANGVVAFDIEKLAAGTETEPVVVYNGHKVASSAFWGTGDDTRMFIAHRNYGTYGTIEDNKIGDNIVTNNVFATTAGLAQANIANDVVAIASTNNGLFFTQNRSNAYGTAGLRYLAMPSFGNIWNAVTNDKEMKMFDSETNGSSGGVDISTDGTKLAITTYADIRVIPLSWTDDAVPVPVFDYDNMVIYKYPFASNNANTPGTKVKYDAAGNLHLVNPTFGYFRILNPVTTTASAPEMVVDGTATGVEDIVADGNEDAAVYYNLNGVRVAQDNLTPGVYVKVVGTTSTKVIVK